MSESYRWLLVLAILLTIAGLFLKLAAFVKYGKLSILDTVSIATPIFVLSVLIYLFFKKR